MTEKHRTTTTLREAAEQFKLAISYDSPQRPWVGLTDEEVERLAATHLFQNVPPHLIFATIFAVQAKLKEKNT